MAKAQGNDTSSAFWSGFAASGFSVGIKGYGGVVGRTMIMAAVSGTVSQMTGGKFSNGAMTGAFIHLFNDEYENLFYGNKVRGDFYNHPLNVAQRIIGKAFKGLYGGLQRLNNLDTSNMKPLARETYKRLMIKVNTVPAVNGSKFKQMDNSTENLMNQFK